MLKTLNLKKRVSCLPCALDLKCFILCELPGILVEAFSDPFKPESARTFFPSGIMLAKQLGSFCVSFFRPPLNVTLSLALAEKMKMQKKD